MKKVLATVSMLTLLAVVGCGGDDDDKNSSTSTPLAACKSLVAENCSKYFGCYSDAELDAASAVVGNNEADCRTKLEQQTCSEQMLKCDSGETYSSSKAAECLEQLEALSCSEFENGAEPAACETVCT